MSGTDAAAVVANTFNPMRGKEKAWPLKRTMVQKKTTVDKRKFRDRLNFD
jgi:hypothetical protein